MRPIAFIVLLAAALAACAGAPKGAPEARGAAATADEEGERLYRSHCAACHRLRDPAEQAREGWARAVEKYGPRAHLDPAEQRKVLAYLQARAKDARALDRSESR